jgi:hypothetical protein
MRVVTATPAVETNAFAAMPRGSASFRDRGYAKTGTPREAMVVFADPGRPGVGWP